MHPANEPPAPRSPVPAPAAPAPAAPAPRRALRHILAALAFSTCSIAGAARAEYHLDVGDVVEIAAAGFPDLKHRATVGIDGELSLPLVGEVHAAGLPLSELRARVRALLPKRTLRRRNPDGHEYPVVIAPDEIMVTIAEHRPVYVSGDVSKPGEQPYRPGMTVQQAVALAGGYDIMRFRMDNPFLGSADLRSEYESLQIDFVKQRAQILRLEAELAGKAAFDARELADAPVPANVAAGITALEAQQMAARAGDFRKEQLHLARAIEQEDGRMAMLAEQLRKEQDGTQEDTQEYERLKELYQRGTIPLNRMTEARRLTLLSATRVLQTGALRAQVERERQDLSRRLQKVDDQRRMELLRDLQESQIRLASIQGRLRSVGEKLVYTGMVKSQLVRGSGSAPDLTLVRRTEGNGRERIGAGETTELRPGDVVEVSLRASPVSAPGR